MIQEVLMPKLGQTMEEAVVEKWHKSEGDPVAKGDVLLEIQTDKATLEVESFVEGTFLKRVAQEGESFPVNMVVALVGDPGDDLPDVEALRQKALGGAPAAPQAEAEPAPEPKPEPTPAPKPEPAPAPQAAPRPATPAPAVEAPPEGRVFSSPRARRVAEEEKVPLRLLKGSGPNGRIVEKDVLAYAEDVRGLKPTPTAKAVAFEMGLDLRGVKGTGPGGKITREDVLAAASAPAAEPALAGGTPSLPAAAGATPAPLAAAAETPTLPGEAEPLSAMRRIVADRMSESKRTVPHFYLTAEADMAAVMALRKEINDQGRGKVAYHDFLVKACAAAMAEQPAMNVAYAEGGLIRRQEINIGLAVAIEDGLMVPVVRSVDRLSLLGVADASRQLIDKARGKKLVPDEYQGGCLTISNLGMFGVDWFYPIINPGEPAILGVGRIADKVVVRDGGIHVRPIMTLALCADHRAVDGAVAAAFLQRVKALLEAPGELR